MCTGKFSEEFAEGSICQNGGGGESGDKSFCKISIFKIDFFNRKDYYSSDLSG